MILGRPAPSHSDLFSWIPLDYVCQGTAPPTLLLSGVQDSLVKPANYEWVRLNQSGPSLHEAFVLLGGGQAGIFREIDESTARFTPNCAMETFNDYFHT
jgi:hypothetical protein